jgi:DeoR/GlpR family transcriptional regulator of sugar metabolism
MFGNKCDRLERLARLVDLVVQTPGLTQAELARLLQVTRATIHKDLAVLEEMQVRLYEDEHGRLYLLE